jgi:hypothetical protein
LCINYWPIQKIVLSNLFYVNIPAIHKCVSCFGKTACTPFLSHREESFVIVVFTLGISTILEYLKLYLLFFKTTKSFKHGGDSLYNILKDSNAIVDVILVPGDFRKIANFNQFKNILLSWNGNECKCNACNQF